MNCSGGTNRALKSVFCVFFSDDRAEKAEAAYRLAGTPSAHEHQPSAARVRPSWRRRGDGENPAPSCATVGTRCNIAKRIRPSVALPCARVTQHNNARPRSARSASSLCQMVCR